MGARPILLDRLALAAAGAALLAVAGCQSGGPLGALNVGGEAAEQDRITVQELTAYCPPVSIRAANAIHRSYQRGGQDDPTKLVFQATMAESTRSCTYNGGVLGMTIAAAGRVVPGASATGGSVTLPIQVRIVQGAEVVQERTINKEVALNDTIGATQWVFTDSSFSMPQPQQANVQVFIGFAEPGRK